MYEAVRVERAGPTTVSRFAATLSRVGFEGMVVRNRQGALVEYDPTAISDRYGIDVVPAIEIDTTDKSVASGSIGHSREEATVLLLQGRNPEMTRFGAESPRLDGIADPMGGDGDLNHVIVKAAKENGVALEVNLGPVLRQSGGPRVQALRGLRKLRELIEAFDAPFVVSASPRTHLQVRDPRELLAVGETIGFDREQIRTGLETWGELAARNRRRDDPGFVSPGVSIETPPDEGADEAIEGTVPSGENEESSDVEGEGEGEGEGKGKWGDEEAEAEREGKRETEDEAEAERKTEDEAEAEREKEVEKEE